MKRVFADTSYFIAMIAPNDAAHGHAQAWANQTVRLVTTSWVMTELAAYLSSSKNRQLFCTILDSVRNHSSVDFIGATQELFDAGAGLYKARTDKEWSLVDCISFIVMKKENISEALSADHHFIQAGFSALLIDA